MAASNRGNGNTSKSNENPHPGFFLPEIENRGDRYCFRCGSPVKGALLRCPYAVCGTGLTNDSIPPTLPKGWKYCIKCKVLPRKSGHNFCRYCGQPGKGGRKFQARMKTISRQKLELDQALSKEEMSGTDEEEDKSKLFTGPIIRAQEFNNKIDNLFQAQAALNKTKF